MDAQARFDEIVDDLLHRHGDAERTQMMGMPSVKSNGKLLLGYIASQLPARRDGAHVPRWLNQQPTSSSRNTTARSPPASTTSK